jgi:hypothetical protein
MAAPCAGTIVVDVSALAPAMLSIEILARMQLITRLHGLQIQLRNASSELQELIDFVGLHDVLCVEP